MSLVISYQYNYLYLLHQLIFDQIIRGNVLSLLKLLFVKSYLVLKFVNQILVFKT